MSDPANYFAVDTTELSRVGRLYADAAEALGEGHRAAAAQVGDISQAYGGYEECLWAANEVANLRDHLHGVICNLLIEDLKTKAAKTRTSVGNYDLGETANKTAIAKVCR